MILDTIHTPDDLRTLSRADIAQLCGEIRETVLETVSRNGGHLASNLGVVEMTVALHRTFHAPHDAILFDVGHQCYAHKLLTGRTASFSTLRQFGGLSGFPCREESEYDFFTTGHSGTSFSAALGMAEANRLRGSDAWTVAVIGDGSFGNGMVYEAMNAAARRRGLRLIVVLNDNEMSISKNVGGLSEHFARIRLSREYFRFKRNVKRICSRIPVVGDGMIRAAVWVKELIKRTLNQKNLFETMGLEYLGPVDGSDEAAIEAALTEAKSCDMPCVVHVLTRKGSGYLMAEENPSLYHAVAPFDLRRGAEASDRRTFSQVFGQKLCALAETDGRICAVTAAMADGTGLAEFAHRFPDRFFDVGIAEEHAVTFSAGLSRAGMLPVAAMYSTFAQRAFDQVLHDAALQKLPLVLALDRCGIVPGDGATHQGLFDVGLFSPIPGVRILAPESFAELEEMLSDALSAPEITVLRYPRGGEIAYDRSVWRRDGTLSIAEFGVAGRPIALLSYGRESAQVLQTADVLGDLGYRVRVIRLRQLSPIPSDALLRATEGAGAIFFVEEGMQRGGCGEATAAAFAAAGRALPFRILAVSDFVRHGDAASLLSGCALDGEAVVRTVREAMESPENSDPYHGRIL